MSESVLVCYASRYGATADIARFIADTMQKHNIPVDVKPLAEIDTLEPYSTVVIGGAIYAGQWPDDLTGFIHDHAAILREKQTAMFVVALRLRQDTDDMRQAVLGTVETQRILLQPVSVGLFAGALDYSKLSPIVRLQAQKKNLPEGDFRNWDAIAAWVDQLIAAAGISSAYT